MNTKLILMFLLILIFIYVLLKNNTKLEDFENIIDNGSFENGKLSNNNIGNIRGNILEKHINPGKSEYVLKQSAQANHKTRYQMNTEIESKTTYVISCWSYHTHNWDGNYNLFNIMMHTKCGDTKILSDAGKIIKTKNISNNNDTNLWEFREYIFNTPINSTGKIDLLIGYDPGNSKGSRYITNIEMYKYNRYLKDAPLPNYYQMFISSYTDLNVDNKLQDLTNNNNNIMFVSNINTKNNYFTLDNIGMGPSSDNVISDQNNFSIIWSCIMANNLEYRLLNLYANNDYNTGITIQYNNHIGVNNEVYISMGDVSKKNKLIYNVGITQKRTSYCLVKKAKDIYFYIDGILIEPKIKKKVNVDLELNSKKMELGDTTGKINLDFFIVLNKSLKDYDIETIIEYLTRERVGSTSKYIERPDLTKSEYNIDKYTGISNTTLPCSLRNLVIKQDHSNEITNKNKDVKCNLLINNKNSIKEKSKEKLKEKHEPIPELNKIDMSKYILKGEIPKCPTKPDLSEYIHKKKLPDMSKYIRKDNIPCWGCNLE